MNTDKKSVKICVISGLKKDKDMTKILVPLAQGLEEIEAISIIDILRRGGAEVTTAGLDSTNILGSHNITILADKLLSNIDENDFAGIVLPGGMPGTLHLKNNPKVIKIIKKFHIEGKLVSAICAAPIVLFQAGILFDKKFTIHPGTRKEVPLQSETSQVVEDGNIITGQASGTATLFALTIVRKLFGQEKMDNVNKGVCYNL